MCPVVRLIRVVDELGAKLTVAGDSEIISSNLLVLAVRRVDGAKFPPTSVDIFNTDNVQVTQISNSSSNLLQKEQLFQMFTLNTV